MKKLIVLGIICMMITACSVAAHAYAGVQLNINPIAADGSFQTVIVGWMTDTAATSGGAATTNAADAGWDTTNGLSPLPGSGNVVMEIINTTIGTSQVNQDFKAPIALPTDFQIWRLKNYVESGTHAGATIGINAEFGAGYAPTNAVFYIFDKVMTSQSACELAIGTTAQIAMLGVGGASSFSGGQFAIAAPTSTIYEDPDTLETSVVWGANPAKTFTVYAKAIVPEPGSMLAMFSGLVGLVGFGIRRRR